MDLCRARGVVLSVVLFGFLFWAGRDAARPALPIAAGQLQLQSNGLSVYAEGQADDSNLTLNVGEAGRIRTCFGGAGARCGSIDPGDSRIEGLVVAAELRGPELPEPIHLETFPGGTFLLPAFQKEGDYFLENIRLVEAATGRVIAMAVPSFAVIHVRAILLASAKVTALSLAELRERGISISQQNYQAFKFSVGFAFGSDEVKIELPVLYHGNGVVEPLSKPAITFGDNPSDDTVKVVGRWNPPTIVPFRLELPAREGQQLHEEEENAVEATPLFGAIVIPGNVSFLNQFFDAKLIVANGAQEGSRVDLADVTGILRLPGGEVLRVASTNPPVAAGQKVPLEGENGNRSISPGLQGSASWAVEGLRAGKHLLKMEIAANLVRPGRDPLSINGAVEAVVDVVDARFHLTFNHPGIVRDGEAYSLYVTVSNLSRRAQSDVGVSLDGNAISGAELAGPPPDRIFSIAAGGSETVEFRLRSKTTGKCVATALQTDSDGFSATIELRTGVGELGIPLSASTLTLPRFTELLPKPLVDANVRLLGLAYSLATAPSASVPAGLLAPTRRDVERRAIDLAEAGQRLFLQDQRLESLEALLLDQLGNRQVLVEFDALRRRLEKGRASAAALGDLLREDQRDAPAGRGFSAAALLHHLGETMSYARPFLAATVISSSPQLDPPILEIRRSDPGGVTALGNLTDPASVSAALIPVRTLPFGEVYSIRETEDGEGKVPLAIVGHLDPAASYRILLHAPAAGPAAGDLRAILPVPISGTNRSGFVEVDFGSVRMQPGEVYEALVVQPAGGAATIDFRLLFEGTTTVVDGISPAASDVALPDFRILGAVQDFRMGEGEPDAFGNVHRPNRYGNGVTYLFNRPAGKESAEVAGNYRDRSTLQGGVDAAGRHDPAMDNEGAEAFRQPNSERVVAVRFENPVSALQFSLSGTERIIHEHRVNLGGILDGFGNPLSGAPAIALETNHTGGLVNGFVVRGTGEKASNVLVQLIRRRNFETLFGRQVLLDEVGRYVTNTDGWFYFDFVDFPSWDPAVEESFILRAHVPASGDEPEQVEEISPIIRQPNRLIQVNIALLGRGTVQGKLVYDDTGLAVPAGEVTIASTLFSEARKQTVGPAGEFKFTGVPVGPLTLVGKDADSRRVYATIGLTAAGQVVDGVVLRLTRQSVRTGTVGGRVVRQDEGNPPPAPVPIAGASVAVYSQGAVISKKTTDSLGNFRFEKVPEGQASLQASAWEVSRTSVFTDLRVGADENVDVTLAIPVTRPKSISGQVVYIDGATGNPIPVTNASVFVTGPGVKSSSDGNGNYRLDGVPIPSAGLSNYSVTAIDFVRQLQGSIDVCMTCTSGGEVSALPIVLRSMTGAIDGVVVDPLGQPSGNVKVAIRRGDVLYSTVTTSASGRFSVEDLPVGTYTAAAHVGDGLQAGHVGEMGQSTASIVFGGHRAFTSIRMVGSGVVRVHTTSGSSTPPAGVKSPIFYKPTYFSESEQAIRQPAHAIDDWTAEDGYFEKAVPVGPFGVKAVSPLLGVKEGSTTIDYPGQIRTIELNFAPNGSDVKVRVVGVDGVTPVPGAHVQLQASGLLPQLLTSADPTGEAPFSLVPPGPFLVSAAVRLGTVDRVGQAGGYVTGAGQSLTVVVRLKPVGTVRGQIVHRANGSEQGAPFAPFHVQENDFPYRRLPAGGGFYSANESGRFEISGLNAGGVTVVAQDPSTGRQGRSISEIGSDFEVVEMPQLVIESSTGSIAILVRDPVTGTAVSDCQVSLSTGDMSVSDANGLAVFDGLPADGTSYSAYAFHAPTGRGGRGGGLVLSQGGQEIEKTILLAQRGEILGHVKDGLDPKAGATVRLDGAVAGRQWSTRLTALATTGSSGDDLGRFDFSGIPEGTFTLVATVENSPRRAADQVMLDAFNLRRELDLVLEPADDRYVLLLEQLEDRTFAVDSSRGTFSVRLQQSGYDVSRLFPSMSQSPPLFLFPQVLLGRPLTILVQELSGKQRTGALSIGANDPKGTVTVPYPVVLRPKGNVEVTVVDGSNRPADRVAVALTSTGGTNGQLLTDSAGVVSFANVAAGSLNVSARSPAGGGPGGSASGSLRYEDQVVRLAIKLDSAVSVRGVVDQPVPNDDWDGNTGSLIPAAGAMVTITDSKAMAHSLLTLSDGSFRFDGLPNGSFSIEAGGGMDGSYVRSSGTLSGDDGSEILLDRLILDAALPAVASISPAPGQREVSQAAPVEIVFTEPLSPAVLPLDLDSADSAYFHLSTPSGAAAPGIWNTPAGGGGRTVRFTPSAHYLNRATYSVVITGGANGVRDRQGRPLSGSGDVGANFTTSDTIGPRVIGTDPALQRPIDAARPIRFDFDEPFEATDAQLEGTGPDNAVVVQPLDADGAPVPGVYLALAVLQVHDKHSLSVLITTPPAPGTRLRIEISGFRDQSPERNLMIPFEKDFRIADENVPAIALAAPGGAVELHPGESVTVIPALSNLDGVTAGNPGGDVDRVEWFVAVPEDAGSPSASPVSSSLSWPFSFSFTASNTLVPPAPRPFTLWARAIDTSGNASVSPLPSIPFVVVPNSPPRVGALEVEPVAPSTIAIYPGSTIRVSIASLDDPDGTELTLSADLRRGNIVLASSVTRQLERPVAGWIALPIQSFEFTVPLEVDGGTGVSITVKAVDSLGDATQRLLGAAVAADTTKPIIDSFLVRGVDNSSTSSFTIGQKFVIELRARDGETAVQSVSLNLAGDVLSGPRALFLVSGSGNLYRTAVMTAPGVVSPVTITATALVRDYGSNESVTSPPLTFEVTGSLDPEAPAAEWLTPWDGGQWPAGYLSDHSGGAAFLLRVHASDRDASGGQVVPGSVEQVEMRGPSDAEGHFADSGPLGWQSATIVGGGSFPVPSGDFEAVWIMPNDIPDGTSLTFEARVWDSHGFTLRVAHVRAVRARRVYEGQLTTLAGSDSLNGPPGTESGPVFFLDGSMVSMDPSPAGPRSIPSAYLYAGAKIESDGALTIHPSVLKARSSASYNEIPSYFPLDLAIADVLGVGSGCRIDASGAGLLGSDPLHSVVLQGESASQAMAGGSHGGLGGPGSPAGGWNHETYNEPGSVYDGVRDPKFPGGGGGGSEFSTGGRGGGVIRIIAPGALVKLAGEISADGVPSQDGAYSLAGGGAGGSIRIVAGRLDGAGFVSASGGDGTNGSYTGGGGGGRISVSYREIGSAFDPALQLRAPGGGNYFGYPEYVTSFGGAGTSFIEALDPATTAPVDAGVLYVTNRSGRPGFTTPLPALGSGTIASVDAAGSTVTLDSARIRGSVVGESLEVTGEDGQEIGKFEIASQEAVATVNGSHARLTLVASAAAMNDLAARAASGTLKGAGRAHFASIRGAGASRLIFDDDLELGLPGSTTVNDRAALTSGLSEDARGLLRNEAPVINVSLSLSPGEIFSGAAIAADWTADDPVGFASVSEEWTFSNGRRENPGAQPLRLAPIPAPERLMVPADAPAGPAQWRITATDLAGRSRQYVASWNVAGNLPPSGSLSLAAGQENHGFPGATKTVVVTAADREGLARVVLRGNDWLEQPVQQLELTGTSVSAPFTVHIRRDAAPGSVVPFEAEITDIGGLSTTISGLSLTVEADSSPPQIGALIGLKSPASYAAHENICGSVSIVDAEVGLTGASISLEGVETPLDGPGPTYDFCLSVGAVTADHDAALVVRAADYSNPPISVSTAIRLVTGSTKPVITNITITPPPPADGYVPGQELAIEVSATDEIGLGNAEGYFESTRVDQAPFCGTTLCRTLYFYPLPADSSGAVALRLRVWDAQYIQFTEQTVPIPVKSVNGGAPPQASMAIPGDRATVPAGESLVLRFQGTDDVGVLRIELYRDQETVPFKVVSRPGYTSSPIPLDLTVTESMPPSPGPRTYRCRVTDYGYQQTERVVTYQAVNTVTIDTENPDWAALATQIGVVRYAYPKPPLDLSGAHRLGGLIVLSENAIAPIPSGPDPSAPVDLQIDGPLWISPGASISATGAGYAPGYAWGPAGPVHSGTCNESQGGSHGGLGAGATDACGGSFGNVFAPVTAGGGGGLTRGGRGGGVISIRAREVVIDGALTASGAATTDGSAAGAGGSVYVQAGYIGGSGTVHADGGSSCSRFGCSASGGGGGRVALVAAEFEREDLARQQATAQPGQSGGGPGTVYSKRIGGTNPNVYGDLYVVVVPDGAASHNDTVLPSSGSNAIQSFDPASSTATTFGAASYDVSGTWWETNRFSNPLTTGICRVIGPAPGDPRRSFTLDLQSAPAPLPNDQIHGAYKFDNVTVGSLSHLRSVDAIHAPGFLEASLTPAGTDLTVQSPGNIRVRFDSGDDIDLHGTSFVGLPGVANSSPVALNVPPGVHSSILVEVPVPSGLPVGTIVPVEAVAINSRNQQRTTERLFYTIVPDTTAPEIVAIRTDRADDTFREGETAGFFVTVRESAIIERVTLTIDGTTLESRSWNYIANGDQQFFGLSWPVIATPFDRDVVVTAQTSQNSGGLSGSATKTIHVSAATPPEIASIETDRPGSIYRSGQTAEFGITVRSASPVATVSLSIEGSTIESSSWYRLNAQDQFFYGLSWLVPPAQSDHDVSVSIRTGLDASGLFATASWTIHILAIGPYDTCDGAVAIPAPPAGDFSTFTLEADISGSTGGPSDPVPGYAAAYWNAQPGDLRTSWFTLTPVDSGFYVLDLTRSEGAADWDNDLDLTIFEGGTCGALGRELTNAEDSVLIQSTPAAPDGYIGAPRLLFHATGGVTYIVMVGNWYGRGPSPLRIDVHRTNATRLVSDWLEAGVGSNGTLIDEDGILGLRFSETGRGDSYVYDYLTPHPALEAFTIGFDGGGGIEKFANDGPIFTCGDGVDFSPAFVSSINGVQSVWQEGFANGLVSPGSRLGVLSRISLGSHGKSIRFEIELKNAGPTTLSGVTYLRTVNPNQGSLNYTGTPATRNHLIDGSGGRLAVASVDDFSSDTGRVHSYGVGTLDDFGALDGAPNPFLTFSPVIADPASASDFHCDPSTVIAAGSDPGGAEEDREIQLLYRLGAIAPGESKRLVFYEFVESSVDDSGAAADWMSFASALPPFSGVSASSHDIDCHDSGVRLDWEAPASWNDFGAGSRFYRVIRDSQAIATIPATAVEEGFESGTGAFTASGAWSVEPAGGLAGTAAARSRSGASRCDTLTLTLPVAIGDSPVHTALLFASRYDTRSCCDGGVVEIATGPDYSSWSVLTPVDGYPGAMSIGNDCLSPGPAFTGASAGFDDATVDLTGYAGQSIEIRFRYATDSAAQASGGWWIDDVRIEAVGYDDNSAANGVDASYRVEAVSSAPRSSDGGASVILRDDVSCAPVPGGHSPAGEQP